MITQSFIEKIHNAFDELNYYETQKLDFKKFEQSATSTLNHCKNLDDAINTIRLYRFCIEKWNKIERVFNRKLQKFNKYDYEGNSLISQVTDEEALGSYYVTNGIGKNVNDVFFSSSSLDNELYAVDYKDKKLVIFEDSEFYIKYSKMSSIVMKLFNNQKECLCNIVLSKDANVLLENNNTPYELFIYEDFIGIYDKSYIETLKDADIVDPDKLVADIEWDILDKKSKFGIARLNVYAENQDLEMLLYFATATFLVYEKYMKYLDNLNSLTTFNFFQLKNLNNKHKF